MTIFDDYKKFKGECRISPHLLWDYDLEHFDWWKSMTTRNLRASAVSLRICCGITTWSILTGGNQGK